MESEDYRSFLVRLWRDHSGCGGPDGWRGEVEHVQTGARWSFSTLDALLAFLHQAVIALHSVAQPVPDEGLNR